MRIIFVLKLKSTFAHLKAFDVSLFHVHTSSRKPCIKSPARVFSFSILPQLAIESQQKILLGLCMPFYFLMNDNAFKRDFYDSYGARKYTMSEEF